MATSDFLQRLSAFEASSPEWAEESVKDAVRGPRGKAHFWMVLDAITIFASAVSATLYRMHTGTFAGTKGLWHGALLHGRPLGILLVFLCGFAVALILTSRRLNLYSPLRLSDAIREQRLSVQACLTSGLLHRSFEQGVGTRNVLIVGTGPEAVALRYYLESIRHLGYRFKGFIEAPGPASDFSAAPANDVVGTLDTLFQRVRRQFVDEIFFTTPCERSVVQDVLEQARSLSVDLRIVPDMYNGVSFNSTIEYIGHFPTIPLHCGQVPEIGLLMKRGLDVIFSSLVLLLGWPLYMAIAIAVKLDSPGPVFYSSERVGKKGRAFRCFKFRTMVCDADKRRQELMNKNERDGVLFKITDDPRVTRLGRFLRRHSLDELPQFVNVLRGDMSVVGPRPLPADDVRDSKLAYLRVLAVTPGITGLWQVQGRQDPSSDSYISLNVIYIENWSIWLDIQIILRTIGVVLEGTGS
jgi:exopolysaccharide biosynthesis polyprenyl glycosylphosphotransferase